MKGMWPNAPSINSGRKCARPAITDNLVYQTVYELQHVFGLYPKFGIGRLMKPCIRAKKKMLWVLGLLHDPVLECIPFGELVSSNLGVTQANLLREHAISGVVGDQLRLLVEKILKLLLMHRERFATYDQ